MSVSDCCVHDRGVPCVRQRLYHADLDYLVEPLLRPNHPYQPWLCCRECLYALFLVQFAQGVEVQCEEEFGLGYVPVASLGKHAVRCPGKTGATPVSLLRFYRSVLNDSRAAEAFRRRFAHAAGLGEAWWLLVGSVKV